ncbi:MAG: tetratricopeptide repeat protein [Verrucomicrobiales bacterium]|nr:tetratricopeptide repeat protein [Verrucomicrobiales bacterium]
MFVTRFPLSATLFLLISTQGWLPAQEETGTPETPAAKRGFRLNASSSKSDPKPPLVPVPTLPPGETGTEKTLPEGAMTIGLVTGPTKLPPELAELAQKGAEAVAGLKWEEAREAYLEMVDEAPDNALAYANLGVAEYQLGNLLAAAGNVRKSLDINPTIAVNWQTLGLIQYDRGDLNLAISSLTRAIHESPQNALSRLYLAAVVRDYGWKEAAITELQRAVELDPKLADAHYNLAITYLELRPPRLELAKRHYYAAKDLGAEPSPEIETILKSAK